MTGPSVLTATPRRGGLRLVVLALTLVGFAAVHAFGSLAGDGAHCGSAPALMMMTDPHSPAESLSPDHHTTGATGQDDQARADATTPAHDSGNLTTSTPAAVRDR